MWRRFSAILLVGFLASAAFAPAALGQWAGLEIEPNGMGMEMDPNGMGMEMDPNGLGMEIDPNGLAQRGGLDIEPNG
ncbi:MAG TPA: hypothetical protein VGG06_22285 [Thermoanaerobaculia bacterium]|jgi:hypothetical protein